MLQVVKQELSSEEKSGTHESQESAYLSGLDTSAASSAPEVTAWECEADWGRKAVLFCYPCKFGLCWVHMAMHVEEEDDHPVAPLDDVPFCPTCPGRLRTYFCFTCVRGLCTRCAIFVHTTH